MRQPGSFTDAAPFSLIASMNFGMSAGLMSRNTALMKRPPACAAASQAQSCNSAAPASTSAPWKEPKDRIPVAVSRARSFLC
ncbi:MAG TPA: hypothetical protein VH600_10430 [Burkholderiales bacterium]